MFKSKQLTLSYDELRLITDFLWEEATKLEDQSATGKTIDQVYEIKERAKQLYALRDRLRREVKIK